MKKRIPFQQVDVFTKVPFMGNPVAVVLDGAGLSTTQMQTIANWTNLSETTFITQPADSAADYRLRIFTPRSELPFAGHPTVGSAHALLHSGYVPRRTGFLLQECNKGLVELRIDGDRLFFRLPPPCSHSRMRDSLKGQPRHWVSRRPQLSARRLSMSVRCGSLCNCATEKR